MHPRGYLMATMKSSMPDAETLKMSMPNAEIPAVDSVQQLKDLLLHDASFAQALRSTDSTEAAARLAAERGVVVTPEALWRNRGTLVIGGLPTWRG
jgi:hypothetical protein